MRKTVIILFVIFLTIISTNMRCFASRYALIIGNSAYANAPLSSPVQDARSMAQVLRKLGFKVTTKINATQQVIQHALDTFGKQLSPQSVALFYFSGHGLQVDGINYLLPVDIQRSSHRTIGKQAIAATSVLDTLNSAHTQLNLIILDACRNNPFPIAALESSHTGQLSAFPTETRAPAKNGLASMFAPTGTVIAYATAPGTVAYEGTEPNSIYTKNLLNSIQVPGLQVEDVFKRVRQFVKMETDGLQVPWEASSLIGDFYFSSPAEATSGTPQQASSIAYPPKSAPSSGQNSPTKRSPSPIRQPQVSLTIDKSVYYEGERVFLTIHTSTDCYIKIYNMNADHHVHVVFPNEWKRNNFIQGGRTTVIPSPSDPFEFIVEAPYGTERLWVEASNRQFNDMQHIDWNGTGFLYQGQCSPTSFRVSKTHDSRHGILFPEIVYQVMPQR